MLQRPLFTGLLVVGIAATALRAGRGPLLPAPELADQTTGTRSALGSDGSPSQQDRASWSKHLDDDPRGAGRVAAREELTKKICDFVSLPDGAENGASVAADAGIQAETRCAGEPPRVMIAIAPDPVHTHLALLFDRAIDAFEDAVQDSGWQYQGYWLPWSSQTGAKTETGEFKTRQQQRLFAEGREALPGVLLFRPKKDNKPLVVFVVTDSPTTGINLSQFREAIRRVSILAPAQKDLKILGPTFTGSGPSLRATLANAKQGVLKDWVVAIASGSITDWKCADFLPGKLHADKCIDDAIQPDAFVSFGSAFKWETHRTEDFLMKEGNLKPSEIAQLTEDESGFGDLLEEASGAGPLPMVNKSPPAAPSKPSEEEKKRVEQETKSSQEKRKSIEEENKPYEGVLKLTFPRGISHLRSAYQKNGVWGFGSTSTASSVSLTLDFDESHEADNSIPIFARQQLPVSQEGSMGQLSAILEQRNIKAVLLSASDIMDELFVAQILAREAPNVTVVVRGADVLFLRSGDGGVYHNMYAVSAWPLIPKNQEWSGIKALDASSPTKIHVKKVVTTAPMRLFPSAETEGIYNATRYLFEGKTDLLQEYRSPLRKTGGPPLWLSTIGHGAYWPIALLGDSDKNSLDADRAPALNLPTSGLPRDSNGLSNEQVPLSFKFVILIACVVALLHAGKCLGFGLLRSVVTSRYSLGDQSSRAIKLWLQLGITLLGLLMLCLLAVPPIMVNHRITIPLAIGVATLSLALAAARLCWRLAFEKGPVQQEGSLANWQTILGAFIFLGAAYLSWIAVWSWAPGPSPVCDLRNAGCTFYGVKDFLFFRATYPLSGSSPTLPLLLALGGLALALFSALGRVTFGDSLAPRLPEKVDGIRNCPTAQSMQGITNLLRWPKNWGILRRNLLTPALIIVFTLVFGITMRLGPQTLEGKHLTLGLTVVLFTVLIAMIGNLVTSVMLWLRLKQHCLQPLESSSLRRGFNAISGITWKNLWLLPQATPYSALVRALEQSGRSVMDGEASVLSSGGQSLRQATDLMRNHIDGRSSETVIVQSFGAVQDQLAKTAEVILHELSLSWKDEIGRITAVDCPTEKECTEKPGENEKRPMADRLRELREEWVSLFYIHYVRLVLIQIRSRMTTAAMLYLLLVWSVTSYPYINRHALMIGLTVLLGALSFVAIWTYGGINRDPILSRTTEHPPGKLDFDFYAKTISMVGIPLVGLVASQFPEVTGFLFSWIEPGMSAVK